MCGIFGVVSSGKVVSDFLKMSEITNRYRGPDATNYYKDCNRGYDITFGHTRLTITGDDEHGRQPLVNDKIILVYNGEIFSFENIHVNGLSDTELLATFLEDGISDLKLNALNGFFSFAIYYPESGTLYLVRDRFGEKPLYYNIFDNALYFSSTARPFKTLGVGVVSPIKEVPGGGISFDENLPVEGVLQVPPGHMVKFKNGIAEVQKWYSPKSQIIYTPNNYLSAVDEFNRLLFDAVRIRIKDQDTVAVSLSGGLDSTLVVDTVKKIGNVNIEAFTLSTTDARFNELEIVKHHSSKIGVNLNIVAI